MNREQYLLYRNNQDSYPLYHYYTENLKSGKALDPHNFFNLIQKWAFETGNNIQEIYNEVLNEYDVKFEVTKIQDIKTGRIIRFI